jgi:hypothetical protein
LPFDKHMHHLDCIRDSWSNLYEFRGLLRRKLYNTVDRRDSTGVTRRRTGGGGGRRSCGRRKYMLKTRTTRAMSKCAGYIYNYEIRIRHCQMTRINDVKCDKCPEAQSSIRKLDGADIAARRICKLRRTESGRDPS